MKKNRTEGEIEYANEKFQEATGYSLEELKRISPWNLVDMKKDEREKKLEHVNEGNEWFGETHYRRKNGALFWAAEHITPIPAQDGGIDRLLWVIEDKTARRVYSTHLENRADPELFTDMPSRIRNAVFLVLSSDNSLMAKLQMENLALDDALREALAEMRTSDAVKTVAAALGLPRKQVYARALELAEGE